MTNRSKSNSINETKELYRQNPASTEKKINVSTAVIAGFITLVIGFFVGINWKSISSGFKTYIGGKETATINFNELQEVYDQLSYSFDGDLDASKVIEEAKRGLVNAAGDKYTYYMTASEAREFKKDLNGDVGAGIGVEIGERDGYVKVLRTTPDNPARRAGVLAGDIIYKANGEDISELKVDDIAKKLRGEAGTSVTLTVVRNGEELDFTLVRETINNVSAYIEYKGDTAILTISRFDLDTGGLAKNLAQEAINRGVKKVIVDLRGNGGGYVSAAKEVASLWLSGDVIVEQRSNNGVYSEKTLANNGDNILANMKTIILINGSTASASEIVAGALKDYGKATLVGETTYGKGSVQALEEIGQGELLRVTIAKWYTPKGKNINGEGIKPDVEVERTFEQINKEIDPQLEAALNQ